MLSPMHIETVDRREFLLGASAAAAVALFLSQATEFAQAQGAASESGWEEAYRKVVGDAKPVEGKLVLELPEIAENGNVVPFVLSIQSPMTADSYVKAAHIFSTANPQPTVATFHFTPLSGKASVASRMRLARTQDIISVAELSDGKFAVARRNVKVTIGGCGG